MLSSSGAKIDEIFYFSKRMK